MEYRHAPQADHRDLASGAVLHSAPGQPAFPVRLALELFSRALEHLDPSGLDPSGLDPSGAGERRVTVWDPCCGAAQLLTTLGLCRRAAIERIVASDVDAEVLPLASRNLTLLTEAGMTARERELRTLAQRHGKASHRDHAEAAARLARALRDAGGDVESEVHHLDALDAGAVGALAARLSPEVVIADLPHGRLTRWHDDAAHGDAATLASVLGQALPGGSIVVLVDRARRITLPEGVRALERVRVGHRAGAIVRAGDLHR